MTIEADLNTVEIPYESGAIKAARRGACHYPASARIFKVWPMRSMSFTKTARASDISARGAAARRARGACRQSWWWTERGPRKVL